MSSKPIIIGYKSVSKITLIIKKYNLRHTLRLDLYCQNIPTLNLEFFIASRVGRAAKKSFSRAILRLAVIAIALSMVVMIIATSIVAGFKQTISEKVFGFWGHIHVTSSHSPSSYAFEGSPMSQDQAYYPAIDTIEQISYQVEKVPLLPSIWQNIQSPFSIVALLLLVLMGWLCTKVAQEYIKKGWRRLLIVGSLAGALTLAVMQPYTLTPVLVEQQTKGGIRHIQSYASKEGIIKTKNQIEGIILRGVGADYDWKFLEQYIQEGNTLSTNSTDAKNGILISSTTARRLELKLDDTFVIYFVQGGNSLARKFRVQGIYKTGLEEYDKRFAMVDIRKIQQLNNWRPFKNYGTELYLPEERVHLLGLTPATGNNWAMVADRMQAGKTFDLNDTASRQTVISSRVAYVHNVGVGDTLSLRYQDTDGSPYVFRYQVSGIYNPPVEAEILQKAIFVNWHSIDALNQALSKQISGFEIFVDNLDDLDPFGEYTNFVVLVDQEQYASTIRELEPNIFDWLNLTDTNEKVILLFMILVSIINMTTSLMILILERTNMIGILKALGVQNWSIRKIFLYNAAYIIGYGLLWGNVIGIGLCWLQMQFGIITLPEDLYYVSVAPVQLNLFAILALNIGTLLITLLVLIIPSWLVTRIDPVKAIRFS